MKLRGRPLRGYGKQLVRRTLAKRAKDGAAGDPTPGGTADALLLEDRSALLMEDDANLLMES